MLNILSSELYKIRRNRVFLICGLVTLVMPLFLTIKDLTMSTSVVAYLNPAEWTLATIQFTVLLLLPVTSGFVITTSMQREYTEHTIINNLTAPVSRTGFVLGKLGAWFLWHIAVTLFCWLTISAGCILLYANTLDVSAAVTLVTTALKDCILTSIHIFMAFLPVFCAAILQRHLFYPSLLACLFLTLITAIANQTPEYLVFKLPWTAAAAQLLMDSPPRVSLIPIFGCGLFSILFSFILIKTQDI